MKTTGGKLVRSLMIAAFMGYVAYLLSRSELSWVLASAIFYNEYIVQPNSTPVSRRRRR
jgi:hypothetical protein